MVGTRAQRNKTLCINGMMQSFNELVMHVTKGEFYNDIDNEVVYYIFEDMCVTCTRRLQEN